MAGLRMGCLPLAVESDRYTTPLSDSMFTVLPGARNSCDPCSDSAPVCPDIRRLLTTRNNTVSFSQWSRRLCWHDCMIRRWCCPTRWTGIGYPCWCPHMKIVNMSVLHHTRFQLHLIWNGSSSFHDCAGPPLWLITAAITDHQYVTHCQRTKLSVHIMTLLLPDLFFSHLPSQISAQQVESSADGMS